MNQHTQSRAEALAEFTEVEIAAELLRRAEERAHEAATKVAAGILRELPELLNPSSSVNKLCELAMQNKLPASAVFAAWELLTSGAADKGRISNPTSIPGGFTVGQRVRDTQSGAQYTVEGTGLLTNHVSVRFDTPDADGHLTGEFYVTFLEPVNTNA